MTFVPSLATWLVPGFSIAAPFCNSGIFEDARIKFCCLFGLIIKPQTGGNPLGALHAYLLIVIQVENWNRSRFHLQGKYFSNFFSSRNNKTAVYEDDLQGT